MKLWVILTTKNRDEYISMIGPIMIGPSSSHTAGAVRLGHVVNKIANDDKIVDVTFELSGSFARTYKGHGTDRALLGWCDGISQLCRRNSRCP